MVKTTLRVIVKRTFYFSCCLYFVCLCVHGVLIFFFVSVPVSKLLFFFSLHFLSEISEGALLINVVCACVD